MDVTSFQDVIGLESVIGVIIVQSVIAHEADFAFADFAAKHESHLL